MILRNKDITFLEVFFPGKIDDEHEGKYKIGDDGIKKIEIKGKRGDLFITHEDGRISRYHGCPFFVEYGTGK